MNLVKKKPTEKFPSNLPKDKITAFCKKWKIRSLSFFGSILRDDFGPDSDIDVLVRFFSNPGWSLLDHSRAQDELAEILGRRIDLLSISSIERSSNIIRRNTILSEAKIYYSDEKAA